MPAKKSTSEDTQISVVEETVTDTEIPEILDKEIDRIIPEPGEPLKLEDGTEVIVRPLKLKELLAFFRILTRGSAMSLGALSMNVFEEQDQFAETLIALLLNALPEAPQEISEFLRVMTDPVIPEGGWDTKEQRREADIHLDTILLDGPEISDTIDIVTAIIYAESQDIAKLAGKVQGALTILTKVTPKTKKS